MTPDGIGLRTSRNLTRISVHGTSYFLAMLVTESDFCERGTRRRRGYSHDGPTRRRKRGNILMTDQSDAGVEPWHPCVRGCTLVRGTFRTSQQHHARTHARTHAQPL
eukprot:1325863-Pyramimonas_sp.AAC.2